MDKVVEEVEKTKKEWDEAYSKTQQHIKEIQGYGKSTMEETKNKNSLPRLNGLAQDGLALLNSLQFNLDLLAPQLPTDEEVQSAKAMLETWKSQSQSLRLSLRNANLQAKDNMRKTAQKERELLGGGSSAQFADKGRNDICCRKHHGEPSPYPSIDGSGGRKKHKHTHDFRGINGSTKEG